MAEKMDVKYKRVLIVNDDNDEKTFYKTYKDLENYKDIILYCGGKNQAFQCITSDNFEGCDKVILDIKIDWEIPDEYKEKISKYVDTEAMKNVNKGFLIFMYLIARGYPIDRIAFLSAYIQAEDSERHKKEKICDMIDQWSERSEEYDQLSDGTLWEVQTAL